jgi:hypothetical protein
LGLEVFERRGVGKLVGLGPLGQQIETIKLKFGNIIWVLVNLKVES